MSKNFFQRLAGFYYIETVILAFLPLSSTYPPLIDDFAKLAKLTAKPTRNFCET